MVDEDKLEELEEKTSGKHMTAFKAQELAAVMFDRNVHRLTDDMVSRKVSNWKDLCR
tara:strand:+ start:186 stop:356 length:171 start_codon:yes stop_codon:yes gene_type:complete